MDFKKKNSKLGMSIRPPKLAPKLKIWLIICAWPVFSFGRLIEKTYENRGKNRHARK